MKKITAYVNTTRVHWLVEELEVLGIKEIMVTEYFSPSSRISRMELVARDDAVEQAREIIHRVGTNGVPGDHSLFIEEYDPKLPGQIPLGKRTSRLEETRVKQLVSFLLRGTHRKITTAFLAIMASVLGIALYVYAQTKTFQQTARETSEIIQRVSTAAGSVETALLDEMLAAERFHRGELAPAFQDFENARWKLTEAISALRAMDIVNRTTVDSLSSLGHQFHSLVGGMFQIVTTLSQQVDTERQKERTGLSKSHNSIMNSLDALRSELLNVLALLQQDARESIGIKQRDIHRLIEEVRTSMILLSVGVIVVTMMVWLMIERNVSRPILKLVEESRTIDTTELR
ncbi:MAG: hypothetical protein HYZ01_06355 [Ignavibacteriales bacterium]|nr:hypothetical protein [Ignavibacteriales bacterium]